MVKELYTSYKPALRICCNYENDKKNRNAGRHKYIRPRYRDI